MGSRWMLGSRQRMAVLMAAICSVMAFSVATVAQPQSPGVKRVAILASGSPTSGNYESAQAQASGLEAVVVDNVQWLAMTTEDFEAYDGLVVPELSCSSAYQTLVDSQAAWSSAIGGNELLIGTDPSDHGAQGGQALVKNGIAFAADGDATGLYMAFECDGLDSQMVNLLDLVTRSNGGWETQTANCYNVAHRVAEHPAFGETTDESLSNWSCSVHNAFTKFPSDRYRVLAIAEELGVFTAPDGSIGLPYVLAAGDSVTYAGRDLTAIGDSVSAGEGIGYGYEWNDDEDRWEDHNGDNAFFDVFFQPVGCHQDEHAHPRVLAQLTGASLREHLSCTGATYDEGIAGVQDTDEVTQPQVGGFVPGPPINTAIWPASPTSSPSASEPTTSSSPTSWAVASTRSRASSRGSAAGTSTRPPVA